MKKTNSLFKWSCLVLPLIALSCGGPQTKEAVTENSQPEKSEIAYDTNDPASIIKAVEMAWWKLGQALGTKRR